jgi:hypothetical protein
MISTKPAGRRGRKGIFRSRRATSPKKKENLVIDKDLTIGLDFDVEPLDFDVEPLDFEVDFSPFEVDFSPELLDSEPPDAASIGDPVAALQAALARATPSQLASARKTVDYLQRKH